jgi:hypothetical protein
MEKYHELKFYIIGSPKIDSPDKAVSCLLSLHVSNITNESFLLIS